MQDMAKLQENDDRVSGSSKKTKLSQFFWSVLAECIFFLCTARGSAVLREEKRCQWEWESASEKLLINQCKDAAVNVIYKDIKMPASSLAAPAFQFSCGGKFKFSKHFYSLQTFVTCIQW